MPSDESAENAPVFDLEERTFAFAKDIRRFVKLLPRTAGNMSDVPQVLRSSGSVGANYIEANCALSKKDFVYRVRVCRKEAKESVYWLRLIDSGSTTEAESARSALQQEATELMKIFGAICSKMG